LSPTPCANLPSRRSRRCRGSGWSRCMESVRGRRMRMDETYGGMDMAHAEGLCVNTHQQVIYMCALFGVHWFKFGGAHGRRIRRMSCTNESDGLRYILGLAVEIQLKTAPNPPSPPTCTLTCARVLSPEEVLLQRNSGPVGGAVHNASQSPLHELFQHDRESAGRRGESVRRCHSVRRTALNPQPRRRC
jgi:hypothetical protein